jgi:hypothetical protein
MRSSRGLAVCLVVALACAGAAWGDDYIGASGGNYDVAANWSQGTVPDDQSAYIRNGATVTLDSSVVSPMELWVGGPSDPSGGAGSQLYILPGAVLSTTTGSFVVAQTYDGTVYQTGGSVAVPYFRMSESGGGNSTYNLSGGSLIMDYNLRGTAPPTYTLDIGRGGGTAKLLQTGGYLEVINNNYLNVGYGNSADSLGELTLTNGSIDISGQAVNIGRSGPGFIGEGHVTINGGVFVERYKLQIGYRGTGLFNQNGGVVLADPNDTANQPIVLGESDNDGRAVGTYNLSAGSLAIGGNKGLRIGSKYNATYGTGTGLFNQTGGSATVTQGVSVGTKGGWGRLLLSNGVFETGSLIIADAVQAVSTVPSEGLVRVSGGSMGVGASGIIVGGNGPGRLEVIGGTLVSPSSMTIGNGDATYGDGTGEVKIGANGYLKVDSSISFNTSNGKLETEIASATKNSQLISGAGIYLNSGMASLEVDSTGYRPKEGDTFTVMTGASGVSGDFTGISSNITLGLPGASAFSGAIVSDPNSSAQYYVVTFLGYTSGDANGDSAVDGGDLALMGGSWNQGGQNWAHADFTGEGTVDGGDLALIGGNWNWSLPPAPGAPLPEPATLALLGLGGLAMIRRKR